jgi:hypothetical protein
MMAIDDLLDRDRDARRRRDEAANELAAVLQALEGLAGLPGEDPRGAEAAGLRGADERSVAPAASRWSRSWRASGCKTRAVPSWCGTLRALSPRADGS